MKAVLGVPESLRDSIASFVTTEDIPINIGQAEEGDVQVEKPDQRLESEVLKLQAGGWITCETARSMASKLNISNLNLGKLLDHLEVKDRECGLGCFK